MNPYLVVGVMLVVLVLGRCFTSCGSRRWMPTGPPDPNADEKKAHPVLSKCLAYSAVVARTACVGDVGRCRRRKRAVAHVERNTQRVKKHVINANVSLIDVSIVTSNMRKKELVARPVERKHQRKKKYDINANVSLIDVQSVTTNTK